MFKLLVIIALFVAVGTAKDCVPRRYKSDSVVCVCNATYCDLAEDDGTAAPDAGSYRWYVSTLAGDRLRMTDGKFGVKTAGDLRLTVDDGKKYQKIMGFGGAFTDSATINIMSLSPAAQENLLRSYFSKEGIKYRMGRVPAGGSDFSTRRYTYDDVDGDEELKHFALAVEDTKYKIPLLKRALAMNKDFRIFSAAWTAPPWMKTVNSFYGPGVLKNKYYQLYADYLVRFIKAYAKYGLKIWAISTGNEPTTAFYPNITINTMGWYPNTARKWIRHNLGPSLANSNTSTQILAIDDQRLFLPTAVDIIFEDEEVKDYVAGIAVHWYADFIVSANRLDSVHENYPEKFILMTEACTGSFPWDVDKVLLGSWGRGVRYILDIIENLRHWSVGWVDWNIALNEKGGPTWNGNYVDSPIIVNATADEFYKQPMFYALAHFSRYVPVGSRRIFISDANNVKAIAFATPDHRIVIVLCNKDTEAINVMINDVSRGDISLELPASSMHTVIYQE